MGKVKYPPRLKASPPAGNGVTVRMMTKKERAAAFGKAKEREKKAKTAAARGMYDKAGTRHGIWSKKEKDRVRVRPDELNDGELRGRWLA